MTDEMRREGTQHSVRMLIAQYGSGCGRLPLQYSAGDREDQGGLPELDGYRYGIHMLINQCLMASEQATTVRTSLGFQPNDNNTKSRRVLAPQIERDDVNRISHGSDGRLIQG